MRIQIVLNRDRQVSRLPMQGALCSVDGDRGHRQRSAEWRHRSDRSTWTASRSIETDLIKRVHAAAYRDAQSADRVLRHLGQQQHATDGDLNDRVIERRVGMNRRDHAGQHIVQAQSRQAPVARMTSRAGIRTRTVVPIASSRSAASSVPPSKVSSTSPRSGNASRDDGIEDAAEPNGLPQPGEVRPTHERRHRPTRDGSALLEHQHVRGKPHDIFEVVSDEDQRHVERPAQAVDLVLKTPAHRRSTAANGSSSSNTAGSRASARASATR